MIEGILTGTAAVAGTGLVISLLLSRVRARLETDDNTLVDEINRVLPQTQCAQCGYPGCRPYAEAIAAGEAINRCPPGGDDTVQVLADLLGREPMPLDPECGEDKGEIKAVIRENECIGCTLCIQACPVDAIVGSAQQMHTVIESECTGCELCLPPCPVDCIDLVPAADDSTKAEGLFSQGINPMECIRCGLCEVACPRDLAPQELYWYREDDDALVSLDLDRCIECRRCDRVCPSAIPLTAHFRQSKGRLREREQAAAKAAHAEARFEARKARLASARQRVKHRPSSDEKRALLDAVKRRAE